MRRFVRLHDTCSKEQRAQVYVKQALNTVALLQGPVLATLPGKASDAGRPGFSSDDRAAEQEGPAADAEADEPSDAEEAPAAPAKAAKAAKQLDRSGTKKRHHQGPRSGRVQKHRTK